MQFHPLIVFLGGLVVIVVGSEILLRSASRIASLLGVRPILIGLTVVSMGTSTPELAVGIAAAAENRGALAVGNIAGTNIFNILFILGLSAAIRPLPLHQTSIRLDVPVMIGTAVVLLVMARDGILGMAEGVLLCLAAMAYTTVLVRMSTATGGEGPSHLAITDLPGSVPGAAPTGSAGVRWVDGVPSAILLLVGIAVTVLGADLLVSSAAAIARTYGVSDAFIGLTIVAIGTSAPELATTLIATLRGDRDVAIGNLIGSSIYNVLVILGVTCIVAPNGIDVSQDVLWIDLPLAAGVAIVCYPVFKSQKLVSRREGIAFVTAYLVYLASLLALRH